MDQPKIKVFFDEDTFTFTYLVTDPDSKSTAIIDPVLNFSQANGRTSTESAEKLVEYIEAHELQISWILETHAHADHLSSAQWLKQKYNAPVCIGKNITQVQDVFNQLFNLQQQGGSETDFNQLLVDGDKLPLGNLLIEVMHTPGHTPACVSYKINGVVFVGDTLFMPDYGSARCDFPGGDAGTLYDSIQKILALPDETKLYMCHDYMPNGRETLCQSTVADQKAKNIHINDSISRQVFIQNRTTRDATLTAPKLILPSIQINIRAGKLPVEEANGTAYLKLPLNKI
jgi:glyoxylase-like metal-dependent hydrolase (beta-lactamase superfamily II)